MGALRVPVWAYTAASGGPCAGTTRCRWALTARFIKTHTSICEWGCGETDALKLKALNHLAGARLGTYSTIKRALGGDEDHISLLRNLVAGCVSGGFAAAVTNPLDLVKTRLQSKDNPYRTIGEVVRAVVRNEGIVGLWAGTMPSVVSCPLPGSPAQTFSRPQLIP